MGKKRSKRLEDTYTRWALYVVNQSHSQVLLRDFNGVERCDVVAPEWAQNW